MKRQIAISIKSFTILVLVLLFLSGVKTYGQELIWTKKASMLYPGVGQSACFYDGKIYVTGGSKDGALNGADYGDPLLQIFDIQSNSWSIGSPLPTARWMHGSAVVDSLIYCIGGGWNIALSANEAYNTVSGTWSVKAPMPTPRSSIGVVAVANKIYAIGGFGSGGLYNLNEMYDPVSNTWTTRASMPTARVGFGTTVVDGKIYVIGGCFSPMDPLKKVEVYDPQTDTWQKKKDMPSYRFGLVLAPVGKKIYALGGTRTNTTPSAGKVEVYDIETDTWQLLANLPDSTQWGAGGSWNSKVYIMGGEDMCMMTFQKEATIYDFLYESDFVTGISDVNPVEKNHLKLWAYPNPFNNGTTLGFEIHETGLVKIELFNAIGKTIQTFAEDLKPQGVNSIDLDGLNLPAGIYFCKVTSNKKTAVLKLFKM